MDEAAAAVVQEEIEVVKQLEAGPTEAELRRRKLVEVDEEVQEERADRLRRIALRELSRALPSCKLTNRREKLVELRGWIRKMLKSDDMRIQDRVQSELKLSVGRLPLMDGQKVDYHDYLNRNSDEESDDGYSDHSDEDLSDDEDDYDHDSVSEEKAEITAVKEEEVVAVKEDIIEFSDDESGSDDDDEADDKEGDDVDKENNRFDSTQNQESTQPQESVELSQEPEEPVHSAISEELRRKFMFPSDLDVKQQQRRQTAQELFKANPLLARRHVNSHQALKMSLYKKVLVAGQENLCKSMNILTSQLDLYQEIVDKCRTFIEIIRDREDRLQRRQQRKDEEDRERRRIQFLQQAYDDDEEFDEDGMDDKAPKLTEEQKQKILADFQNWPDEEDVEEDEEAEDEEEEDEEEKRLKSKLNDKKLTEKLLKKIKKASGEEDVPEEPEVAAEEDEASSDDSSASSEASEGEEGDDDSDDDSTAKAGDADLTDDNDPVANDDLPNDDHATAGKLRKLSKKKVINDDEEDGQPKIAHTSSTHATAREEQESGPVVRRTYGRAPASQRMAVDSDDDEAPVAPRRRSIDDEPTAPQQSLNSAQLEIDQSERHMSATQEQVSDSLNELPTQQTQSQRGASNSQGEADENENENEDEEGEDKEEVVEEAPKPKKPKSSMFRKMVEEEERRSRVEKMNRNRMLEDEAEEEEEEGVQAGLGDFGFGVSRARDDDEADALRIRKGDFDHIVDDVSDDEGDEEAGERARLELERKEDLERTKAVINAVTEGHTGRDKRTKSKFTFDKLVSGRDEEELLRGKEEGEAAQEEEFDEEEMLQRGLQARAERENARNSIAFDSDDEEMYSSDEEDENFDEDLDEEALKKREEERRSREEQRRKEYLQMRMFNKQDKIRRTFRRIQNSGENLIKPELLLSRPSDLLALDTMDEIAHTGMSVDAVGQVISTQDVGDKTNASKMSGPLLDITNMSHGTSTATETLKRRTSMVPKKVSAVDPARGRSRPPSGSKAGTSFGAASNSRSGLPVRATSLYCGSLNTAELDAGYGMGMAVTAANSRRFISRQTSADSGNGSNLFSHVTGFKRSVSESSVANGASNGSSFHRKRSSSSVTAVSASQFVFTNTNTNLSTTNHHEDSYLDATSRGGDSNFASKLSTSHTQGGFSKPSQINSSLFAKLNSAATRPGALKRKPSIAQH